MSVRFGHTTNGSVDNFFFLFSWGRLKYVSNCEEILEIERNGIIETDFPVFVLPQRMVSVRDYLQLQNGYYQYAVTIQFGKSEMR
jgi:hypothetical protein